MFTVMHLLGPVYFDLWEVVQKKNMKHTLNIKEGKMLLVCQVYFSL